MTATVWLAGPQEAEAVAGLLCEFRDWEGRPWPSDNAILASVERLIERPDTEYLLGTPHDDSGPAGISQLRYRGSVWTASDDCNLEDLFVRADARRGGLGRALVAASLERARLRGCRRIELDVNEANPAALALYEQFGFDARAQPYGGRNLWMRRRLEQDE